MSRIQIGYGSEWHLLRFLGRHRTHFTKRVLEITKSCQVEWLDFPFIKKPSGDAELQGLDFLAANHPARQTWAEWWPQTGNIQNWDAVARLHFQNDQNDGAWLLVEAKGHLEELKSPCNAKSSAVGGGREQIESALKEAKDAFQVKGDPDWCRPYYQYANRLAVLHFLLKRKIPAHLLFVYFVGDRTPGKSCPPDANGWLSALNEMKHYLGLDEESPFKNQIHELFISVDGACSPPAASKAALKSQPFPTGLATKTAARWP
jgi:hypothetical protein